MELRQIVYFLKVAETLHYGKAARQLGVTTQPLSFQIKKLEEELGYDLFWRTTRSVRITPAGAAFREHAEKAMKELESAVAAGQSAKSLLISCSGSVATGALSKILSTFASRYPEVRISISGQASPSHADVCINELVSRSAREGDEVILESHEARIAVPATSAVASASGVVDASSLGDLGIIAIDPATSTAYAELGRAVEADLGITRGAAAKAESPQSALALVAAGIGACIVDERQEQLGVEGVVILPVASDARITVTLSWNAEHLSPIAESFVACARETVG